MQLFIQMVYARDCNLNNNGVIHPETIVQQRSDRPFLYYVKGYTSIERKQRQAPVNCIFAISLKFLCSSTAIDTTVVLLIFCIKLH